MWIQRRSYGGQYAGSVSRWHLFRQFTAEMRLEASCQKVSFGVTNDVVLCLDPIGERCSFCLQLADRYVFDPKLLFTPHAKDILQAQEIEPGVHQIIYAPPRTYPAGKHRWDR